MWAQGFVLDTVAAISEGMKKFRQSDLYQKRFISFGDTLKSYMELEEDDKKSEGLEQLMLEAYRFMKFLRKSNNITKSDAPETRPVEIALYEVVSILDEPLENCAPIYMEADALEIFSYSVWVQLKQFGDIKHCKTCKAYLFGKCKKHKAASSVSDLMYCKKCNAWLDSVCVHHGSNACVNGDDYDDSTTDTVSLYHGDSLKIWDDYRPSRSGSVWRF